MLLTVIALNEFHSTVCRTKIVVEINAGSREKILDSDILISDYDDIGECLDPLGGVSTFRTCCQTDFQIT